MLNKFDVIEYEAEIIVEQGFVPHLNREIQVTNLKSVEKSNLGMKMNTTSVIFPKHARLLSSCALKSSIKLITRNTSTCT